MKQLYFYRYKKDIHKYETLDYFYLTYKINLYIDYL